MYFEPNPFVFYAAAKLDERAIKQAGPEPSGRDIRKSILFADTSVALRYWGDPERTCAETNLRVIRGYRQGGAEEFDPSWWEFDDTTPIKGDEENASRTVLTFRGSEFTKFLRDVDSQRSLRNFRPENLANGARSLYRAFIKTELIQLYVVDVDPETDKQRVGALPGALVLQLRYGPNEPCERVS